MPQALQTSTSFIEKHSQTYSYQPDFIFVLKLKDGRIAVGQANQPGRRIAAINSGMNKHIKRGSVLNIVGIKERTSKRSYLGVAEKFIDQFGEDNVATI